MKIKFFIVLSVLTFKIFAQIPADTSFKHPTLRPDPEVKTYLSFSGGASIPISDFAAKEITNNASGFAVLGYNASASLNWIFKRGFGFEIMYRYQSNSLDNQSLTEQSHIKYPTINFNTTSTPWKNNLFMIGTNNSFLYEKNSKLYFDIKFLIGVVKSTSFGMIITGTQNGNSSSVTSPATDGTGFGFCGGLGTKYEIFRRVFLGINADYFSTTINYRNITLTSTSSHSSTISSNQKITSININLSLTFRLN